VHCHLQPPPAPTACAPFSRHAPPPPLLLLSCWQWDCLVRLYLSVCFVACSHSPASGTAMVPASLIPSASSSPSLGYDILWLTCSSQIHGVAESAATIHTTTNMGVAPLMSHSLTWDCRARLLRSGDLNVRLARVSKGECFECTRDDPLVPG
jgi:hypothetical protein